ncbi:thiamine pyrophosphate-dependent enzyme, partial [Bordetella petrii]|uniref:thiamine pyrophosphate-dependent enzyme n=1 Tax=Bordetella petrii TaxID=94624 RepID=UPI001E5F5EE3
LIVAGGALEKPGGREALRAFAQAWQIPVAVSFRRHDLYPNDDALYAGELGLSNPDRQIDAFQRSDLVLALGTRLGDVPTQGYRFPTLPRPGQRLVHCYPDDHVVGLNFAADHGLVCDPVALLEQLAHDADPGVPGHRDPEWAAELRALHQQRAAWNIGNPPDGVDFNHVVRSLATHAPDDVIVCLDAGTFAAPVYRHFPFAGTQRLMSPLAGAMGYGTPAAIASALRHPGRKTVCLVGDGGFLMTGNEMIAAVQRRLPILFIVSNNNSYGSIRLHQERYYPGRISGTALGNPDFPALAAAFGMAARRVDSADQVDAAIAQGLQAREPQLIEVRSSLQAVLPGADLPRG